MRLHTRTSLRLQPAPAALLLALFCLGSVFAGCSRQSQASSEKGRALYHRTCSVCHGMDARGMRGLGKSLIGDPFVAERSRDELTAFLKVGRRAWDPLNTTGVDMPPRGGNAALTDEDLAAIADFLKDLPAQ